MNQRVFLISASLILSASCAHTRQTKSAAVQKSSGGWNASGRYEELYRTDKRTVVRGTVTSTDDVPPSDDMNSVVQLRLDAGGKEVSVDLGPRWFILEHDINFTRGEPLVVVGVKIQLKSKPAIVAHEIDIPTSKKHLVLRDASGTPQWPMSREDSDPASLVR